MMHFGEGGGGLTATGPAGVQRRMEDLRVVWFLSI